MLVSLVAALAVASSSDGTDADASGGVELSLPDDLGGSALDGLESEAGDGGMEIPGLPLRGRFGVRPVLNATFLSADRLYWAVRAGVAVDHRYWFLSDRTVELAGQTELQALFPIGAAFGRRFTLDSTLGPWIGPVGLRVGPTLRSDRIGWRTPDLLLENTLAIGVRGDLSLEAGRFRASVGLETAWLALGNRPPADPAAATLPVIGDETAWRLGLGHQGDRWLTVIRGTWRETAIGAEIDAGLQLGLRLF